MVFQIKILGLSSNQKHRAQIHLLCKVLSLAPKHKSSQLADPCRIARCKLLKAQPINAKYSLETPSYTDNFRNDVTNHHSHRRNI